MVRVENTYVPSGTAIDLGGGYSVANAVLADLGMNVFCVDLMGDYFEHSTIKDRMESQFNFLQQKQVKFINVDLLNYDFARFQDQSADVVCSFHAFEHFHHSPKNVCDHVIRMLKPKGVFFLEVPNAVNLLKRLKVLMGKTNYLPYQDYFLSARWVGHVREYTVDDIMYLVRHYSFESYSLFGRNYYGTLYSKFGYGRLASLVDYCLRLRPGLCGALYLRAEKSSQPSA